MIGVLSHRQQILDVLLIKWKWNFYNVVLMQELSFFLLIKAKYQDFRCKTVKQCHALVFNEKKACLTINMFNNQYVDVQHPLIEHKLLSILFPCKKSPVQKTMQSQIEAQAHLKLKPQLKRQGSISGDRLELFLNLSYIWWHTNTWSENYSSTFGNSSLIILLTVSFTSSSFINYPCSSYCWRINILYESVFFFDDGHWTSDNTTTPSKGFPVQDLQSKN